MEIILRILHKEALRLSLLITAKNEPGFFCVLEAGLLLAVGEGLGDGGLLLAAGGDLRSCDRVKQKSTFSNLYETRSKGVWNAEIEFYQFKRLLIFILHLRSNQF